MRCESIAFALGMLWPGSALAICTSFGVTATSVDFGVYDPSGTTETTGGVAVQCGIGVLPAFTVGLSKGSGSYAQRQMLNGSDKLTYNLYTDAAHMTVWGDGTGSTVTQGLSGLITLGSTTYTVYGLVDAAQYPAPGPYTDTITVAVNF
ncbi:MAG TPA: spore coat U domain-containing protein [Rhizomicrobium sp.]